MSEWVVKMTSDSETELRNIYNYIATTLLVPNTATKQIRRIFESIKSLSEMPKRFSLCEQEHWRNRGVRKFPVDNFVVFYYVNEKANEVMVLHIFYGGQNIESLLKNNLIDKL